jgi:hypothetical protein
VSANRGVTPRQSVLAECERRGQAAVITGCIGLLEGADADDGLIFALGGPAAATVLSGREGGRDGYWPRVWAARGLLHVWADNATPAIIAATDDESWRVREMAAKVIARHQVGDALAAAVTLTADPVLRVAAAADRAVMILSAARA